MTGPSAYEYTDDPVIAVKGTSGLEIMESLSREQSKASDWFDKHKLSLNLTKTKVMFFRTSSKLPRTDEIKVQFQQEYIEPVTSYKYLGITLDSRLTFSQHVEVVRKKGHTQTENPHQNKKICHQRHNSVPVYVLSPKSDRIW